MNTFDTPRFVVSTTVLLLTDTDLAIREAADATP